MTATPDSVATAAASTPSIRKAPIDEMTFGTAPNILTLIRMLFVPLVVSALFMRTPGWDLIAAILFGVASITDFFDGYLARKQQVITIYGKLLDPLADKFLVVSSLVMLQYVGSVHPVIVILLVCREIAITGLRALASAEGVIIPASGSAKWKTAIQMFAIPFSMVRQGLWGIPLFEIGMVLLYVSLAISLWSAKDYVVDFFKGLKQARALRKREREIARQARRASRESRFLARLERQKRRHEGPDAGEASRTD